MIDLALCFSGYSKTYDKQPVEFTTPTVQNIKKNIHACIIRATSLPDNDLTAKQKADMVQVTARCMKAIKSFTISELFAGMFTRRVNHACL